MAISASASALAFFTICRAYVLNSGLRSSPNATALAAMMCMSGPPWLPGKTLRLIALDSSSSLVRIIPPRGPRRVLCVVVVTTWACGNGDGCAPPTIRPAMWATSAISSAPTSSAISRNLAKSIVRG